MSHRKGINILNILLQITATLSPFCTATFLTFSLVVHNWSASFHAFVFPLTFLEMSPWVGSQTQCSALSQIFVYGWLYEGLAFAHALTCAALRLLRRHLRGKVRGR